MKKVLVCIEGHPKSHLLVDYGFRKAREATSELTVLNIISPSQSENTLGDSARIIKLLETADKRGADVVQVTAASALEAIQAFLEGFESGDEFSTVIAGSATDKHNGFFRRVDLATQLTKRFGGDLEIITVPLSVETSAKTDDSFSISDYVTFPALLVSVGLAAIFATLFALPSANQFMDSGLVTFLALASLSVVGLAYYFGLVSSLLFILASIGVLNHAGDPDLLTLCIMGGVNMLTGAVIARLNSDRRRTAAYVQKSEARLKATYSMLSNSIEATDKKTLLESLEKELSSALKTEVSFLLSSKEDEDLPGFEILPNPDALSEDEVRIAEECWQQDRPAGFGTTIGFASPWRFELISTPSAKLGVLAVKLPAGARLDLDFLRLVSDLSDHIAIQLAHLDLLSENHAKAIVAEREQLRSLLLSSVSHDLKTPLASIIGSLQTQRSLRIKEKLTPEYAEELEKTAIEEAERLTSFIDNILSMTELESGQIKFNIQPADPREPLSRARRAVKAKFKDREVELETVGDEYEVPMDAMLVAQVLQNLLDNAAKYSPTGSKIHIRLQFEKDAFTYSIRDNGPGIPETQTATLFDKFERLNFTDSKVAGTGLGLAISKAIMEGHSGSIHASNVETGGAQFDLVLPLASPIDRH